MLITIAIAEEIQGSKRIAFVPEPIFFEDLLRLPPSIHAQNNKISSLTEITRRPGGNLRRSSKNVGSFGYKTQGGPPLVLVPLVLTLMTTD